MNRAERVYLLLKASREDGMSQSELARKTGLIDTRKAVSVMKKTWLNRNETLQSRYETATWFGFFPRKQKRYFITNTRS